MKKLLMLACCVAAFVTVPAGAATAGEVKGPPSVGNVNETGALDHAQSHCAASGLNDMIVGEGQTVSKVQTAADSWKYYEMPKGAVGTGGLCRGFPSM